MTVVASLLQYIHYPGPGVILLKYKSGRVPSHPKKISKGQAQSPCIDLERCAQAVSPVTLVTCPPPAFGAPL